MSLSDMRPPLLLSLVIASLGCEAAEYCVTPTLQPGVMTVVEVADITHPHCGMALIQGKYTKLDGMKRLAGEVLCSQTRCTQMNEFRSPDGVPYPVLFVQHFSDASDADRYARIAKDLM